jgi:hypothetical protein
MHNHAPHPAALPAPPPEALPAPPPERYLAVYVCPFHSESFAVYVSAPNSQNHICDDGVAAEPYLPVVVFDMEELETVTPNPSQIGGLLFSSYVQEINTMRLVKREGEGAYDAHRDPLPAEVTAQLRADYEQRYAAAD